MIDGGEFSNQLIIFAALHLQMSWSAAASLGLLLLIAAEDLSIVLSVLWQASYNFCSYIILSPSLSHAVAFGAKTVVVASQMLAVMQAE